MQKAVFTISTINMVWPTINAKIEKTWKKSTFLVRENDAKMLAMAIEGETFDSKT